MTVCEDLENRRQLCIEAARRCLENGIDDMAAIWHKKAVELKKNILHLSIAELERSVK